MDPPSDPSLYDEQPDRPGKPPPDSPSEAVAGPNFCGDCGAPWVPGAAVCLECAERYVSRPQPIPRVRKGPGSLRPALGLYFALLTLSAGELIAIRAGAAAVVVEFAAAFLMALIVLVWCLSCRQSWLGPMLRLVSLAALAAAAAVSLLTIAVAVTVVEGFHWAFGMPLIQVSQAFLDAGYGWATVFLMVAVLPAVVEEIAFRGVVLQSLQPLLTPKEAVIVSALMFMILHLALASFPHTFLMGLAAGWLCVRSGSLLPGMLLHFLHNSYCLLLEWAGLF